MPVIENTCSVMSYTFVIEPPPGVLRLLPVCVLTYLFTHSVLDDSLVC